MKIPLAEAAKPKNCYKEVESDIIISGKQLSPFIIPKTISVSCSSKNERCAASKCKYLESIEVNLFENISNVLRLINQSENKFKSFVLSILELSKHCPIEIKTVKMSTIEQLIIIPDIVNNTDNIESEYVVRQAYLIDSVAECNKGYSATLYSMPDPVTNILVHVITKIDPKEALLQSYRPNSSSMAALVEKFHPGKLTVDAIWSKLYDIADKLANNVTFIYDRPLMTIGVDLVFHSPLHFNIGNEYCHKGWGEILIVGDTQCGKGATCERLSKFYSLGEVASGENATFVGLVGGIQNINEKTSMLTWGKVVLNNGRLVIIDEISSLSIAGIIRKMSRIRSEGVSELDKAGIHARAEACTRLIWISNPKTGRPMRSYRTGIDVVKELIDANEDVTRFDYILTALEGEVSSEVINTRHSNTNVDIDKDDERALIVWIWSRGKDDIVFSKDAINAIYQYSRNIPTKYTASVPLCQAENFRFKLAKVACMIAGRLCITDEPYTMLHIPKVCVDVAAQFLEQTYKAPGLAYDMYSQNSKKILSVDADKIILSIPTKLKEYMIKNKYLEKEVMRSLVININEEDFKLMLDGFLLYSIIESYNRLYISNIYNERKYI